MTAFISLLLGLIPQIIKYAPDVINAAISVKEIVDKIFAVKDSAGVTEADWKWYGERREAIDKLINEPNTSTT